MKNSPLLALVATALLAPLPTTLLAVDAMNDPRGYMVGKRLIEMGKSPAPEVVADPATDMKALLKA